MSNHQEMFAMVEAMVEECVEEAVKAQVESSAMTIVNEVLYKMSKTDPGFSSISETVKRKVSEFTDANITLLAHKSALEAQLVSAKKVAAASAAMIKKLEHHRTIHKNHFEILHGMVTKAAMDNGEDTLGAGGDITSILIMAETIHDKDKKCFKNTLADLKNELPDEAYVQKIGSELSALVEQEKAIDKLFEDSDDEGTIKDEQKMEDIK